LAGWRAPGYVMRELRILFTGSVIATAALLATPLHAQPSKQWLSCINKNGRLSPDLAIGSCTSIIQSAKESPKNLAVAFNNRAWAYSLKDQYGRAIEDFTQAISLDPTAADAFYRRGTAYLETGQFDRAIADFDQALRLDPQFISAFNNRGNAYALQKQYDRAIADYNAAIRLDSNHANAYNGRGAAYNRKGQYDWAIEDFSEAIRLDPKDSLPVSNRGNAYALKEQYARAIEDYNRAIRLDATNADAFNGRCWARGVLGRELQEAIRDCNESIRLDSGYANAFGSRGFIYIRLGQFDRAIADYNTRFELEPKSAYSLYGRGYAKQKAGDVVGASADIAAAKAIWPEIEEQYAKYGLK
jgi:tetratricopeptide (TPR) repeat protein